MHDPSYAGLICAVFLCTVFNGLLGLAQSCSSATQRNFLLLVLYFTAFLIAIIILFGVWMRVTSHLALQLLLELSWLNGLSIEAVLLGGSFSKTLIPRVSRIFRILVPTIAAIAGLLQVVGFGVSFHDDDIGRYTAFAGGCLFHVSAAAVIGCLLIYEIARNQNAVLIALAYACAAVVGVCLIFISGGNAFLLANCILECCVLSILLVLDQINRHKEGDGAVTAGSLDEGSLPASSSLTSPEEATARNVEKGPWQASIQTVTVQTTQQQHNLPPTPPPSPVLIQGGVRYGSTTTTDATNNLHSTPSSLDALSPLSTPPLFTLPSDIQLQGLETSQIHPLQSTASSKGISVQVIALDPRRGGRLRLVDMDWKTLSPEQTMQVKKHMGDFAYNNVSEHYSKHQPSPARKDHSQGWERILWAGRDLSEWIPSSEDCRALRNGMEIGVEALRTSVAETWGYHNCWE